MKKNVHLIKQWVRSAFILHNVLAWIVLILSVILTFMAWKTAENFYENRAKEHFAVLSKDAQKRIETRMLNYEYALRSGIAFFQGSDHVTRAEWHAFVNTIKTKEYYPGIQGIGFAMMLTPEQLPALIQTMRDEGYPTFSHYPKGSRSQYSSILYLEPLDERNRRAIGYDMFSEPVRQEAMKRARDSAKPSVSGKVTLVQENDQDVQAGMLMYLPLYKSPVPPASIEERRSSLIGFVYSPFRMNDLMKGILIEGNLLDFEIEDISPDTGNGLLYRSYQTRPDSRLYSEKNISIGGRIWKLGMYSTPKFEAHIHNNESIVILTLGLIFDLFLFFILVSLLNNRQKLQIKNAQIESRQSRLQSLLESSTDGIHILDPDGNLIMYSDSFIHMLGYTPEEALALNVRDWDAKLLETEVIQKLEQVTQAPYQFETSHRTKEGIVFDVEISSRPIQLDGQPYIYCSSRDITERKKQYQNLFFFQELLDNSNDMVFIIRMADMVLEYVNNAVINTLGYSDDEIKAIGIAGIRRPLETEKNNLFHTHLQELHEKRKMTDYAILTRKDGSEFLIEANAKAVTYNGTEYNIAIVRDITEREELLKNLQQTTSLFEEAQHLAGIGSWIYEHESGKNEWSEESYHILCLDTECEPSLETFLKLVHPNDRKALRHSYNESVREHTSFDSIVQIDLAENLFKYIRVRGQHYYNAEGQLLQSRGTFHDVTETVISRQIIENDRERFRAIAEMGSDWYWENNAAGILVHLSDNVSKTLGYETSELLGKKLIDLASVSMPEQSISLINECFKKRQLLESFIIDIDTKEGEPLIFELNAEPIFTATRKFDGYRGMARNITMQQQLQKQMIEQNNELRTIFETSRDGIVVTDFDGNFLDFNKAYMDITGYSRGELMGMCYRDVTPQDQIEDVYQQALKLLEGEPYVNIVKTTIDKQGKRHTLNLTITLMPDHQRVLATIKDITEQQQKANELSETYERLKMATEAANIGIWIWDIKSNKLIWDEKMFHIYHIPAEKRASGLTYTDWISRVHPEDIPQTEHALQTAVSGGNPYNITFRVLFDEGIVKYIQATAIVKFDSSGDPITMIGINRDVTNDRTVEQALVKAKTAAEEANRSKSNFIANMSHEIRTPLNGLIGLTELTLKTELTPLQSDYLKKADQSAKALMNVINDILDYSKIEAGKFTLDIHPFNLKELLQVVYDLFEYKAIEKNLDLEIDLYSDVPNLLMGDSIRLTQVLINLIGNAIKFTDHGSVRVKISHHLIDGLHELLFQIVDTGIGISSENLQTLYEPFSQADTSFTRKYGGTGLGLVISKELIHLMDGELSATSTLGQGSTFAFSVRLQAADEAEIVLTDKPQQKGTEILKPFHILLVEDNDINQIVASEKLKALGMQVTIANNGKEAVEMVTEEHFDLIFMDLQMPVMDGFEATRQIRRLENGHFVPIIALSAAAMQQDRELSLQAGMNDHLSKPIINSELETILKHYLSSDAGIPPAREESAQDPLSSKSPSFALEDLKHSLQGNHELTVNLFSRFYQQYGDYETEWMKTIKDPKTLSTYLHSLKGISGNLQMMRLNQLCRQYEQNKNEDVLSAVKEELDNVLSIIRPFLEENSVQGSTP